MLAGLIAIVAVAGLGSGSGGAAARGRAPVLPSTGLPSLTAAPARFSPAQLQAMLPANGHGIPDPYSQTNPGLSLRGLPFPIGPQKLACDSLLDFFGGLGADDGNYAAISSMIATDPSLDTTSTVVMEADSLSYAKQDLAALRDAGHRCPTASSSGGTWRVTVRSVPGLGDDNVDIAMSPASPGPDGTRNGPQDVLLARQGSDLVEVDYQLSGPPGVAQSAALGPSVAPPSASIIRSILARL